VGRLRALFSVAICTAAAISPAGSADLQVGGGPPLYPVSAPRPVAQWEIEAGGRYWYSTGRTKLNLFGFLPGSEEISRLTYSGLQAHSGEIFGRAEHVSGFFAKGFIGGGAIGAGTLRDEDFPSIFLPGLFYSSTNSEQRDGKLAYGTIDLGWTWRSEGIKFGFFGGYMYYNERVNAFGCQQTGLSPVICVPSIPGSVLVITQDTTWNAIRIGVNGEWRFAPGWRVSGDLAWIPYASLSGTDTHWLRTDIGGPTAENGINFFSIQAEAFLTYEFLNGLSVGIGGRYWRFRTDGAQVDFPGLDQQITLITERWGGFLQASYKWGILRPTRYN
jgi:hypothetical protein